MRASAFSRSSTSIEKIRYWCPESTLWKETDLNVYFLMRAIGQEQNLEQCLSLLQMPLIKICRKNRFLMASVSRDCSTSRWSIWNCSACRQLTESINSWTDARCRITGQCVQLYFLVNNRMYHVCHYSGGFSSREQTEIVVFFLDEKIDKRNQQCLIT